MPTCEKCGVSTYSKPIKRTDGRIYALCNKCSAELYEANKARRKEFDKNTGLKNQILSRESVCQICGTHSNLTIDHIISIAKGGSDNPSNLRVLCSSCNRKKGAK